MATLLQGPGVKFQGGVRLFDEAWVGDTGTNATQGTTNNSTLTVDPGSTAYSSVQECGRDVSGQDIPHRCGLGKRLRCSTWDVAPCFADGSPSLCCRAWLRMHMLMWALQT